MSGSNSILCFFVDEDFVGDDEFMELVNVGSGSMFMNGR